MTQFIPPPKEKKKKEKDEESGEDDDVCLTFLIWKIKQVPVRTLSQVVLLNLNVFSSFCIFNTWDCC